MITADELIASGIDLGIRNGRQYVEILSGMFLRKAMTTIPQPTGTPF